MNPMTTSATSASSEVRTPSGAADILDTVRTVAVGLLIAMAIQTVALQPYTIPSSSMESTRSTSSTKVSGSMGFSM